MSRPSGLRRTPLKVVNPPGTVSYTSQFHHPNFSSPFHHDSLKRAFSSIQNHELESPPRVFGQASVTPVSQIALRKFPLARPPSPTAQTSSTSSYRVFPPPLHLPASISLTDGTDAEAPAPRIWHGETEYPGMERVVWVSELGLATEANLREVFRHSGFM